MGRRAARPPPAGAPGGLNSRMRPALPAFREDACSHRRAAGPVDLASGAHRHAGGNTRCTASMDCHRGSRNCRRETAWCSPCHVLPPAGCSVEWSSNCANRPEHRTRVRPARGVCRDRPPPGGSATGRAPFDLVAQRPHADTRDGTAHQTDPARHRPACRRPRTGMGTGPTALQNPVAPILTQDDRTLRGDPPRTHT